MADDFELAARAFEREVDREAARLLSAGGLAPWKAIERAVAIVIERRRIEAIDVGRRMALCRDQR